MRADGDSVDTHGDDRIVVPAGLGHVAKVEDVGFFDVKFFEEMSHAKFFIHARSGDVDRGSTTDFVEKIRQFFAAFGDDSLALFQIRIPSIFGFGAGGLTEGRKGDLGKAIFDNFVALGEFVGLPKTEFFGSFLEGCCNFYNIFVFERVVIDLMPIGGVVGVGTGLITVILSALGDKKVQMLETLD